MKNYEHFFLIRRPFLKESYCPTPLCPIVLLDCPCAFVACSCSEKYMLYVRAKKRKRSEMMSSKKFSQKYRASIDNSKSSVIKSFFISKYISFFISEYILILKIFDIYEDWKNNVYLLQIGMFEKKIVNRRSSARNWKK